MDPKELRAKKAEAIAQAKKLRDDAAEEKRDLTEEEEQEIAKLLDEAKSLEEQAVKAETSTALSARLDGAVADLDTPRGRVTAMPEVGAAGQGLEVRDDAVISMSVPHSRNLVAYGQSEADLEEAYRAGQMLAAVLLKDDEIGEEAQGWCRDHGIDWRPMAAAQTGGINTYGGAVVPTEFSSRVIDLVEQYGVWRRMLAAGGAVYPMVSDTLIVPRRTAGLTSYFVGDTDAVTESRTSWDNVALTARKLAVLCRVPTSLVRDSMINWADRIALEAARAFSQKEDECCVDGDGTSTYGGIVGVRTKLVDGNHAGSIVDATSGDDQFLELIIGDLLGMISKSPNFAGMSERWILSKLGYATALVRLAQAQGGATAAELMAGGRALQFLGYPVEVSQAMPKVTTALNDVVMMLFGDPAMACTMGTARAVTIRQSEHRYFEYDQIGILATERFDFVAHDLGDSTNPGALIGLTGNT